MTAKTIMIQGTMSSVGKSLLGTALCRIFTQHGLKVAPFKAQNMSNNAAVCADGGEIGRAQYTQALAAGIEATVQMNPILIKPEADMQSQIVVNGRVWRSITAGHYYTQRDTLWLAVTAALDALRADYDLLVIEGAGSPAELNLKRGDIVNMAVAHYAEAPVLLAGDVDRGGIFAQLLGTLMLLDKDERERVKGLIVNIFRGDMKLFEDGIQILESRASLPVLGVVLYLHDLALPEEDAVAIEPQNRTTGSAEARIDIAVMVLPRIANFDDFDPLAAEPGVHLRFVASETELGKPDAIILPGTKSTIADLNWLHDRRLADHIIRLARTGTAIVGICGGYQMLGQHLCDPQYVESTQDRIAGLGLLPIETSFQPQKATYQATATITGGKHWLADLQGQAIIGYEIHIGQTTGASPWLTITERGGKTVQAADGAMSTDGRVWGSYLHGLFHNDNLRHAWLKSLGWESSAGHSRSLDAEFDRLADAVETNLDMTQLARIIGL